MSLRLFGLSTAAAVACLSVSTGAQAPARSIGPVLDTLDRVRSFHETAISPDGRRVAWVEDVSAADGTTAIVVRDLPSGEPRRVTAATDAKSHNESGVAWPPDSESLAFLSDARTPHQQQLCRMSLPRNAAVATGMNPGCVTNVTGQLAQPKWSPDGSTIAFLFVSGSTQGTGALVAYTPDSGLVGDVAEEQRIAIADPASGAVREVSPANMFVYDYDWSPDGQAFAAEAVEGSGTNNYWIAQLYVVRADTGQTTSIWKPPLQIAGPRWSPDGTSIAVIHGIMSDEGSTGGDIYVVPARGGAAKNVTPHLEGSARSLAWRPDGRLLFQEYVDGQSALVTVGPTGGARTTVWSTPQQHLTSTSIAAHADAAAAVVQSFQHAPEVYAGAFGAWAAQTQVNAAVTPLWGDVKSLHWTSDKYHVQGWLMYPANFDPAKKYPLVVSVHGGPSAANFPSWPSRWNAVLPASGYFVLLPNPRGSYGGGEAFTQANVNDFGYGDLRDIEAGVDAAVKAAPIDPARTGIIGWSYGGFMSMWAVTQTTRFKAAVAGAGIANWQSYYGQNKIDTWMLPFFGASVYDKPEAYSRSSPITYIKKVRTPTLVLHGDRDSEVPTPQGYEFWHALKALGVPTELVIYPEEGHAIAKPEHQRDIEARLLAWFDRYLMR
ncbi:MAG: tolB protein [Acidobacteria bacterium]|nr:tolB protein [Acidobacteriota bacterium]